MSEFKPEVHIHFDRIGEAIKRCFGLLYEKRRVVNLAKALAEANSILDSAGLPLSLLTETMHSFDGAVPTKSAAGDNNPLQGDETEVHSDLAYYNSIMSVASIRIAAQELRREQNISEVIDFAYRDYHGSSEAPTDSPDVDWLIRFFNIAQDISDKDVQSLWGKILAGEVARPCSYSLRTLELLKNLSRQEANLFVKVSRYRLEVNEVCFIANFDNFTFVEQECGLTVHDRIVLQEAGLLSSDMNLTFKFDATERDTIAHIKNGEQSIAFYRYAGSGEQTIPSIPFTTAGSEISRLVDISVNMRYLKKLKDHLTTDKSRVTLVENFSYDGQVITLQGESEILG